MLKENVEWIGYVNVRQLKQFVSHWADAADVSIALISLIVYLFAATSGSFAATYQVLSSGHSKPIESIKLAAWGHLCAQLPSAIDARSKFCISFS